MNLLEQAGRHIRIVYTDQQLSALSHMRIKIEEIHFSGYLSKDRFLRIVTHFIGLKALSVPPWAHEKVSGSLWWERLPVWIRGFLVSSKFSRRFWTEGTQRYVRGLLQMGHRFSDVSALIYYLFRHKIKVKKLISRAITLGWIPKPKPKPFPCRLKNY